MDPGEWFEVVLGLAAGMGLAAACGFRVFVPMLVLAVAARAEVIRINGDLAWISSTPAIVCLSLATALEIGAYYLPVVDNFLDSIATPAAAIAGALVAAAVIVDIDPWLRWTLALIAGTGAAAAVQIPTVLTRGASTATTGGVGNPAVASGELVGASVLSGVSVLAPVLIPVALIGAVVWLVRRRRRERALLPA